MRKPCVAGAGLPTRPWYHATDHKVRSPVDGHDREPLARPQSRASRRALYRDPDGRSSSSTSGSSSAPGSSRRTSRSLPEPGSYLTATAGTQPVLVLRDEDGELRAFRNVCRHRGSRLLSRLGRVRQGDPLPLPRLDLPARRRADRRAGGAQLSPGSTSRRSGCSRRGWRRSPGSCSSTSTRTPRRSPSRWPASPSGSRRTGSSGSSRTRPLDGTPAGQLEDRRPTTTSRATTCRSPTRADAPARLQALRRRGARQLGLVRGAAARQAVGQPDGARSTSASSRRCPGLRRGRPARLALRLHLSEHRDRPLSRPGLDLEDRPDGVLATRDTAMALPPPGRLGCARGSPSA